MIQYKLESIYGFEIDVRVSRRHGEFIKVSEPSDSYTLLTGIERATNRAASASVSFK